MIATAGPRTHHGRGDPCHLEWASMTDSKFRRPGVGGHVCLDECIGLRAGSRHRAQRRDAGDIRRSVRLRKAETIDDVRASRGQRIAPGIGRIPRRAIHTEYVRTPLPGNAAGPRRRAGGALRVLSPARLPVSPLRQLSDGLIDQQLTRFAALASRLLFAICPLWQSSRLQNAVFGVRCSQGMSAACFLAFDALGIGGASKAKNPGGRVGCPTARPVPALAEEATNRPVGAVSTDEYEIPWSRRASVGRRRLWSLDGIGRSSRGESTTSGSIPCLW